MTQFGMPQQDPSQQHQPTPRPMPPGWYPDPWTRDRERWWDGYQWGQQKIVPLNPSVETSHKVGRVIAIALGVFVVVVLVLGAVAGSKSSITTTSASAITRTIAVTTAPTAPPATPATTGPTEPPTTAAAAPDTATLASLKQYLETNFAGTSWLPLITQYEIQSSAVFVSTSIYKDADAAQPAAAICGAISGWIINHPESGLHGVRVAASDGQRLALRTSMSPGDSCL